MIDWLLEQLDFIDLIVLTVALVVAVYYAIYSRSNDKSKGIAETITSRQPLITPMKNGASLVERMKSEGRQVLIIYGSQTGTAEELAGRLAKDLKKYGHKAVVQDPEEMDPEDFGRLKEIPSLLLLMCMATYGEGDPTDNAHQLHDFVSNNEFDLEGVRYAIFGLGNKTYEHYNAMGKYFDKRLEQLGAIRVFEPGVGDDDGNLEEDFMRWREAFLPAVANSFGWNLVETGNGERQYRYEIIDDPSTRLFLGEYGRIGAFDMQRPPYDAKNPFLATVRINRELHKPISERSCRHIELETVGTRLRYEAGDHLGVYPTNDQALVDEIATLLNVNLDQAFKLINTDEESSKRYPFPCPCTMRTALTHYVDICAPVKSHVLKALSEYATDEKEKNRLIHLSTASESGLKDYGQFIQKDRRSILDVLRYFKSCKPPIEYLLELLPRLQARYYSISSSPRYDAESIALTAVVTKYMIGDRLIKGVCTNYLLQKQEGDKVPVYVRKSTMRLPHEASKSVIMIGPGTGFAPFRAFIQERKWQKEQGKPVGPMYLYFGCRRPDVDYIYEDELKEYVSEGVITELHVAFSRITDNKIYVQNKLWENRESVWKAVEEGAYIYVCGDARNMARDVQSMFLKIIMEVGGKTQEEAQKEIKSLDKQRRYQTDVWS
ncbi:hypothetical protein AB6A40_001686 [Gnathostoma spinigerum]|uniref:NADPH--cytochrome P450 reductase n=1 Tax=Gnathostoma spinigerum TaxID=75299 RepID=A0ABD6EEM8_9BILA